jgi:hypothetical protein
MKKYHAPMTPNQGIKDTSNLFGVGRPKKTCADYIFVFMKINPKTGIYDNVGVSSDESLVADFLTNTNELKRVEIFHEGRLEGQVNMLISIEEFEEMQ